MIAMTRIGFWQTGQRSGSTCQTRKMRSRHRLEGSLRGGCGWRDGHAGRGGFPYERALQFRGFGGEGAGGFDGAGVFLAQPLNPGGGQRQFLAPDALHFAYPGVGIEFGHGKKLVFGLFAPIFQLDMLAFARRSPGMTQNLLFASKTLEPIRMRLRTISASDSDHCRCFVKWATSASKSIFAWYRCKAQMKWSKRSMSLG